MGKTGPERAIALPTVHGQSRNLGVFLQCPRHPLLIRAEECSLLADKMSPEIGHDILDILQVEY